MTVSAISPYMALAAFPLATWLTPNPTRFSWGFHHRSEPMPVELREKAESADRYRYFLVDAIIVAFVVGLMLRNSVPAARVGLQLSGWKSSVAIGAAAGGLRVLLQRSLVKLFPSITPENADDHFRRRSLRLWVAVFFAGAFSEELWIAFCLVLLRAANHSMAISVALTAAVFGAVHFEYRFGAFATAAYGATSALLFLWHGSLIPMFLFHLIANLGSLSLVRHR